MTDNRQQALDAAEARGRAEVAAKVEALALDIIAKSIHSGPAKGAAYRLAAEQFRSLANEVTR